eukprot:834742-Amphidinium_carterae.1
MVFQVWTASACGSSCGLSSVPRMWALDWQGQRGVRPQEEESQGETCRFLSTRGQASRSWRCGPDGGTIGSFFTSRSSFQLFEPGGTGPQSQPGSTRTDAMGTACTAHLPAFLEASPQRRC